MKILIGADLVPTQSNFTFFAENKMESIVSGDLLKILRLADYRIFNLEVPLTDANTPIKKCGPNLSAPTNTIAGMKALGVDLFTLANNHILDQGEQGLASTIQVLKDQHIRFSGVGKNLQEASRPIIIENENEKIGIYCCAEHEFSIATKNSAGANPFDPFESFDHVQALKEKVDYVIVLYHGGKEHYRYPSIRLQRTCRKLVEKGADLVVCQHSHCVGCQEIYQQGTIVYGQGNFLFDFIDNEYWKTSLLIQVDTSKKNKIEFIPLQKEGNGAKLAANEQILLDFFKRTEEIKEDGMIEKKYEAFAKEMRSYYLTTFHGHRSFVKKALNRITKGKYYEHIAKKYKEEDLLAIKNYIECEAHQELLLAGLKKHE